MLMHALRLESPREFRLVAAPEIRSPGPGEALVRVHRVGICGTDISAYLGKMPFVTYPRILGHELGVEVVEIGRDVITVQPGDRCSVEPYINDPTSYASRKGRPNCCERLEVLGVHRDGGMRPMFTLPARKLHFSSSLTYEQLALVETLAIGCHAVARSGLAAQEHCLVIGAGPIGLATLEFVRIAGVKPIVLETNAQRIEFCRTAMKIEHAIIPSESLETQLRDLCDGHLPDVVIDATGSSQSMSSAFGLIAPGGRLVFVGLTAEEVRFKHPVFHRPEGTLVCSRNALPEDFTRIIGLIEQGCIDTQPWITHRTTLAELPEVFASYLRPESGVVKAMVEVSP
jgi:2-desacetyl-2-hydroxyethyl bacteriochlorophyllide A dehydrogenase